MWSLAASTTVPEWITAASTLVLGVFAAAFGVLQFAAEGFRPKVRATIDVNRAAISVQVRNRGRGAGVIARVVLVDGDDFQISRAPVRGYPDEAFEPTTLPAHAAMRLIVGLPPGLEKFPPGVRVKVGWGTGATIAEPLPTGVGYGSLQSVLPPRAS